MWRDPQTAFTFTVINQCNPEHRLVHISTVIMKNYIFANFNLHNFKSLGYRKLANIRKSMQIQKPFVQKNKNNCFLYKFLGKITSPQIDFFQFPIFVTI